MSIVVQHYHVNFDETKNKQKLFCFLDNKLTLNHILSFIPSLTQFTVILQFNVMSRFMVIQKHLTWTSVTTNQAG